MNIPPCPLCGVHPEHVSGEYGPPQHRFQCYTFGCVASYIRHETSYSKECAESFWTNWANTISHPAWRKMDSAPKNPGERVLLLHIKLRIDVASWSPNLPKDAPWLYDSAHRTPRYKEFQPIRWAPLDPRERQPASHGAGVSE